MGAKQSCVKPSVKEVNANAPGKDVLQEKFPMWVMPLTHALQLTRLCPHEEHRGAGTITTMQHDMLVSFISHQWLGAAEPDRNTKQFKDFQHVVGTLIDQSQKVLV
mmetsp:Transcript_55524/g.130004  ORF Transcript_55524/g.130004 Transcript_55524/m.130004 type:complete len:106 (-) Transcript_55524:768-1085(-)